MRLPQIDLAAALLVLMISGCAATPVAAPDAGLAAPIPLSDAGEARYQLLVAEIALSRRDLQAAARAYLEAGRNSGDIEVLRRAAGLAYSTGDLALTDEAVTLWSGYAPNDGLALRYRLVLALQRGDATEAAQHLAAMRASGATDDAQLLTWLRQSPDTEATMTMLTQLSDAQPDDLSLPRFMLTLAGEWEDDRRVLDASARLIAAGAADERVLLARSPALERSEGATVALAELDAVTDAGPDLRRRRGELRFAQGDLAGARSDLELLLAERPEDPLALYLLGEVSLADGRLDAAGDYFQRLQGLSGMGELGHFMQARLARTRGESRRAISMFDDIEKQDLRMQAQLSAAAIEIELDEVPAAMRRTDELILEYVDDAASIRRERAATLAGAGHLDLARSEYQAMLVDAPDDAQLRYGLALVLAQAGDTDAAVALLEVLVAEDPESPDYMNALGYTLADAGRELPRARMLVRDALERMPDSPAALDSMGWIEFRTGHVSVAEEWLRQAWALDQDPEIAAHLGEVLWALGRHDEAREIWDLGAADDPGNALLHQTRSRLDP